MKLPIILALLLASTLSSAARPADASFVVCGSSVPCNLNETVGVAPTASMMNEQQVRPAAGDRDADVCVLLPVVPVGGVGLGLRALWASLVRLFRRR